MKFNIPKIQNLVPKSVDTGKYVDKATGVLSKAKGSMPDMGNLGKKAGSYADSVKSKIPNIGNLGDAASLENLTKINDMASSIDTGKIASNLGSKVGLNVDAGAVNATIGKVSSFKQKMDETQANMIAKMVGDPSMTNMVSILDSFKGLEDIKMNQEALSKIDSEAKTIGLPKGVDSGKLNTALENLGNLKSSMGEHATEQINKVASEIGAGISKLPSEDDILNQIVEAADSSNVFTQYNEILDKIISGKGDSK